MVNYYISYLIDLQNYIDLDALKEPKPEKTIEPDSELGDLGFYSSACNDEFTTAQMESIIQMQFYVQQIHMN